MQFLIAACSNWSLVHLALDIPVMHAGELRIIIHCAE